MVPIGLSIDCLNELEANVLSPAYPRDLNFLIAGWKLIIAEVKKIEKKKQQLQAQSKFLQFLKKSN